MLTILNRNLNDIWSIVEPDEWKKKSLGMLQPFLVAAKGNVERKLAGFLRAKTELVAEVASLGNLIQNEVLPKFWPSDIALVLLWIETVLDLCTSRGRRSTRRNCQRPRCSGSSLHPRPGRLQMHIWN